LEVKATTATISLLYNTKKEVEGVGGEETEKRGKKTHTNKNKFSLAFRSRTHNPFVYNVSL
jgi:hypothetical protein